MEHLSKDSISLIDWNKVKSVTEMIADDVMDRSDMKFDMTTVKIYQVGTIIRIDIQGRYDNG